MNDFKYAKAEYEAVPIPPELANRVQTGLCQGQEARRTRQKSLTHRILSSAACFAVLLAALNLSPTVAQAAANVPILGGLFQIMTVIRYDSSEGGINYSVSVPMLESDTALAEQVNAIIQEKMEQHLEKAQQDWAEYQEAFFAAGGTAEEWDGREMDVFIDYEVKHQTDAQVSFVVTLAEGWVASMEERYYYNLDLAEDRSITLQNLLGEDWVSICNAAVSQQIAASTDPDGFSYFFPPEEGGFTTVDETTPFYIREDGIPVLAFPPYSIAAGAAGTPEFPVSLK